MLKFKDLTIAQKRFIVAVIEHDQKFATEGKITLKECGAVYDALRADRTGVNSKIGYPNWLFKTNKVERGVYQLPVPTAAELSAYQKEIDAKANPIKVAKAKVAKLVTAKATKKTAKVVAETNDEADTDVEVSGTRLNKIIEESEPYDQDVEDFNAILRENGIEV